MNQKGDSLRINGDIWTIVDVAPASELAEMVAVILEEEGLRPRVEGLGIGAGIIQALGANFIGTSFVLVPKHEAEEALKIIEECVTDYTGEDIDRLMDTMSEEDHEKANEAGSEPFNEPEDEEVT